MQRPGKCAPCAKLIELNILSQEKISIVSPELYVRNRLVREFAGIFDYDRTRFAQRQNLARAFSARSKAVCWAALSTTLWVEQRHRNAYSVVRLFGSVRHTQDTCG